MRFDTRLIRGTVAALALPALLAMGALRAQAPTEGPDDTITLNFVNADIHAVVKAVAEMTGRNFLLDPRVQGTVNIIAPKPVPRNMVFPILLSALRVQGFAAVGGELGYVNIVPEADAKFYASAPARARSDQIVTEVFRLAVRIGAAAGGNAAPARHPEQRHQCVPGIQHDRHHRLRVEHHSGAQGDLERRPAAARAGDGHQAAVRGGDRRRPGGAAAHARARAAGRAGGSAASGPHRRWTDEQLAGARRPPGGRQAHPGACRQPGSPGRRRGQHLRGLPQERAGRPARRGAAGDRERPAARARGSHFADGRTAGRTSAAAGSATRGRARSGAGRRGQPGDRCACKRLDPGAPRDELARDHRPGRGLPVAAWGDRTARCAPGAGVRGGTDRRDPGNQVRRVRYPVAIVKQPQPNRDAMASASRTSTAPPARTSARSRATRRRSARA